VCIAPEVVRVTDEFGTIVRKTDDLGRTALMLLVLAWRNELVR
jgi:hypothetical protein